MAAKIFSLTNGILILADTVDCDDNRCESAEYQLIQHPMKMDISDDGIKLGMWMPCDMNDQVKIYRSHIVGEAVAIEPLANEYHSKFGGIVKAPAGLVL
jgi:hypothetical protein